jgi:hypothetical protein
VGPAREVRPGTALDRFIGATGSGQHDEDGGHGPQMLALSQQLEEQLPPGTVYQTERD